jgi:hypothetical protein
MGRRLFPQLILATLVIGVVSLVLATRHEAKSPQTSPPAPQASTQTGDCRVPFPLPRPSDLGGEKFEKLVRDFLLQGCYKGWVADSQIRNSGPFINGKSWGTHNSVKIYYSPESWSWLKARNREGDMPDGAMIIKEMFPSPAKQDPKLTSWTVMVKDKKGSYDGWYWSYQGLKSGGSTNEIDYPDSGFALYCMRCHASAEKESTFLSLKNVEGDPISFYILVPTILPQPLPNQDFHERVSNTKQIIGGPFPLPKKSPDLNFLTLLKGPVVKESEVKRFPGESLDHVYPGPRGTEGFVSSSQCMGCHSASKENMAFLFTSGDGGNGTRPDVADDEKISPVNLSPYTEWRASMMGLAGRDPIFHAQLESEKTLYPSQSGFLDNTCYRCHGVMGQRQIELDKNEPFKHSMVYAKPDEPDGKYGALSRDGVSCAACHRIAKEGLGTAETFTGKFKLDPPGFINGPYEDVISLPMNNALNITPRYAEQIKTSAVCGSCHTVVLPVFDTKGKPVLDKNGKPKEFHEQTTYPEWQNSIYQNEREPYDRKTAKTCQDCHMPKTFLDKKLTFRIANIEDNNYPYTEGRARDKDITVKVRDEYARHSLVGINQFGIMMFQQFPDILGIRTADYMYDKAIPGLLTALKSGDDFARNETAKVEVTSVKRTSDYLEASVRIENLAGHSLPSGVAFRRAFLALEVVDGTGKVVWASGRTNSSGAIVKGTSDQVLATEFFYDPVTRKQVFQPHHSVITDESQVQIYEELIANTEGKITTSFVALDHALKNNRLLPKGWRPDGPMANVTGPHGEAEKDPEYVRATGSSGSDTITYRIALNDQTREGVAVVAVLYYQSIPPYYLRERFTIGRGPETKRLAYITSHLSIEQTPLENWKLALGCAARGVNDTASVACQR